MSVYLIDILREVTESTKTKLALSNVNYLYAPVGEIIETISAMSKGNMGSKKYPFVSIITDIEEIKGERSDMLSHVVIPTVVFACLTRPELTTSKRYDWSFKAILQPLYEEWINQLFRHNNIYVEDSLLFKHKKTDRLSWGKSQTWASNGKSVDFIDAIEVNGLDFWIRKSVCKTI